MDDDKKLHTCRVHIYEIKKCLCIAKILTYCGKDMALKYNLHHWDNPMLKSLLIVVMCLLKNKVYLLKDEKESVATFQTKEYDDALFFEKLAVSPNTAGKGYGSYCIKLIETKARKLGYEKVRMEVYDKSKHAIDFYLHKGYLQVGTVATLKYKNLVMEKVVGK